jgi:hypothetical protein
VDGILGDVTKSRSDYDGLEPVPEQVSEPAKVAEPARVADGFDPPPATPAPALKPKAPTRKPAAAIGAPVVRRFGNEPFEPAIDLKTVELAVIEKYVADLKAVLGLAGNDSVEKLLNRASEKISRQFARDGIKVKAATLAEKIVLIKLLDAGLKNLADAQSERQKECDELAHKRELFSPSGDAVVNVCVTEKGKEPVNASVRFFENPLDLAKENKKRSGLGLSPFPDTFIKSNMVNYLATELSSSQTALSKLSARAQDLKSVLSELEKEKSGDIALNLDAVKSFSAKIVILKKWESALQKRRNAPIESVAPKKLKVPQTDPLECSQAFRIGQRSVEGLARFIV